MACEGRTFRASQESGHKSQEGLSDSFLKQSYNCHMRGDLPIPAGMEHSSL